MFIVLRVIIAQAKLRQERNVVDTHVAPDGAKDILSNREL